MLVLAISLTSTHASTDPKTSCEEGLLKAEESLIQTEFSRVPNDLRGGLVSENVPIEVESLKESYRCGYFPWSVTPDGKGRWFCPPQRGILDFSKMRIGSSDMRFIRRAMASGEYEVTYNKAFRQVVEACRAMVRWKIDAKTGEKVRDSEWISDTFVDQYTKLHEAGYAHSTEVWHNGKLVAGMYGVFVDGVYAGESMFHTENDAAKLALYDLVERLTANGHEFMDTQMAAGLAKKWGAILIPREEFLSRLKSAQSVGRPF